MSRYNYRNIKVSNVRYNTKKKDVFWSEAYMYVLLTWSVNLSVSRVQTIYVCMISKSLAPTRRYCSCFDLLSNSHMSIAMVLMPFLPDLVQKLYINGVGLKWIIKFFMCFLLSKYYNYMNGNDSFFPFKLVTLRASKVLTSAI